MLCRRSCFIDGEIISFACADIIKNCSVCSRALSVSGISNYGFFRGQPILIYDGNFLLISVIREGRESVDSCRSAFFLAGAYSYNKFISYGSTEIAMCHTCQKLVTAGIRSIVCCVCYITVCKRCGSNVRAFPAAVITDTIRKCFCTEVIIVDNRAATGIRSRIRVNVLSRSSTGAKSIR